MPGRFAWVLFVDVVILECSSGNLYDCIGLAAKAALLTTKIPVVRSITSVYAVALSVCVIV